MELISRMMDGSIPYDAGGRLEPVSSGRGTKQDDKIDRLKEVPLFEGCSHRQLRSVAKVARPLRITQPQGSPARNPPRSTCSIPVTR